jgi:hypothetical protein
MRYRLGPLGLLTFAAACAVSAQKSFEGEEGVPQPELAYDHVGWTCPGLAGTTKSPHGKYYITAFGCWSDGNGNHSDPGDNCIPACIGKPGYKELCGSRTGPQCERYLNWFAADADRFGCFARILVTNPHNGKGAVLAVIDRGPNCAIEKKVKHWVLDVSYPAAKYLWGEYPSATEKDDVVVTPVDPSTPLGPYSGGATSSSAASTSSATSSSVATAASSSASSGAGGSGGMGGAGGSGAGGGGAGGISPGKPIVIDTNDANNSVGTAFEASSSWTDSTNVSGYFGDGYLWRKVGATTDLARFEFSLDAPHTMAVEAWWTAGSDRSTQAPFLMYGPSDKLLATAYVNQQKSGGSWVKLGTYSFGKGWNAVALSRWTGGSGVVIADAVRVTPLD